VVIALAIIGLAAWSRAPRSEPGPTEFTLDAPLLSVTAIVVVAQSFVCFTSGFWNGDLYLAAHHAHDGVVHLAMAAMMRPSTDFSLPWPPPAPFWGDGPLVNYHPSSDVLLSLLAAHDDHPLVYLRVFPVLESLLFCFSFGWLFTAWGAPSHVRALGIAVCGLASSLGHLTRLAGWHAVDSWTESHFWMSQLHSMDFNPPFAFSLSAAALGLALLPRLREHFLSTTAAIAVLWGLGFSMKSFMSLVMIAGLFWAMLLSRGIRLRLLLILSATVICATLAMAATTRDPGGAVEWKPFWPLISLPDRTGMPRPSGPLALPALLAAFLLGNLGIRVLALRRWARAIAGRADSGAPAQTVAAGATMAALTVPLLYGAKGATWNTIQFGYYALAFTAIWCTWPLARLLFESRRTVRIISATVAVALALPGTGRTLTLLRTGMVIPRAEVETLHSLAQKLPPRALVLAIPGTLGTRTSDVPGFLAPRDATETSYVSALSGRPTYYADVQQLQVMRIEPRKRRDELSGALRSPEALRALLLERHIAAVYRAGDPPRVELVP
jgi:hypothetical protein